MKQIIYMFFVVFAFAKAETLAAQNYQQHTVVKGETLSSISRKYKVATSELLQLNPDVANGVKEGAVVLIPAESKLLTQGKITGYNTHKVRRKETLFSLSKEYGVTILDIKEANKELYNQPLNRGDKIRIPVFEKPVAIVDKPVIIAQDSIKSTYTPTPGFHKVEPAEGYYRIAILYKTSVERLKELNPEIQSLKPGMFIKVPEVDLAVTQPISTFTEYEVPSKMGMYSLTRMTGLSKDSLLVLNPQLKEGLKAGMILKIPNKTLDPSIMIDPTTGPVVNLLDSLRNFQSQYIAIMLPLSLHTLSEEVSMEDQLIKDKTSRIAVDFLNGMYEARDSARTLGIKVNYDVYDTQKSKVITSEILQSNDFQDYNAVVGPLLSDNVMEAAKLLKKDGIPVISPLTTTDVRLYNNLFQSRPDDQLMKERLKNFLSSYAAGKNVIIVTDNTKPELKAEFASLFPDATVLIPDEKKNYIYSINYIKALKQEVENVVILAVDNVGFITDAVTNYSAKTDSYKITMFGMESYENMNLPNGRLALLNYTFPQMHKDVTDSHPFIKGYTEKHGISPNKYVTRGFDIAMDLILRQASADDFFESVDKFPTTEMTESKFSYTKKLFSGYSNQAVYMLQYQHDLTISEVLPLTTKFN